jgi:hypothetical protein
MNSLRFLFAAGATWFNALYVASSSWTRIEGILLRVYQITIYKFNIRAATAVGSVPHTDKGDWIAGRYPTQQPAGAAPATARPTMKI